MRFSRGVPEAVAMCQRLGLGDQLVSPSNAGAYVWRGGDCAGCLRASRRAFPARSCPSRDRGSSAWAGWRGPRLEPLLPRRSTPPDALGPLVSSRFGREVLERLVDPLIGGINAGDADRLSALAVAPQVAGVAERSRSLLLGLRADRRAHPPDPTAPVFFTLRGGMGGLIDALAASLAVAEVPATVELDAPVEFVEIDERGAVQVTTGALAANPRRIDADALVLACPAHASARLLADAVPEVAATLLGIDYSVGRPRHLRLRRRRDRPPARRDRPARTQARPAHGHGGVLGVDEVDALAHPWSGHRSCLGGPRRRRPRCRAHRRRPGRRDAHRPRPPHGSAWRAD